MDIPPTCVPKLTARHIARTPSRKFSEPASRIGDHPSTTTEDTSMHKPLLRSALLATVLACSSLAFAAAPPSAGTAATGMSQPAKHRGGHHMNGHHMKLLDQLNLSDTQRTSVHQLFQQNFEQARPDMQTLRQKRMAFDNATPGSSAYQSAANDLAQAESNAAHAQVLRQAELRTRIYNLLTPEQRTQYATLRAQHQAKMKQWRESHMQKRSGNAPASSAAQ
jgi:Spy/CpxP family protein refolding chaperone